MHYIMMAECQAGARQGRSLQPLVQKALTVQRELRIAMTAAMKNVLSPTSDAPMTPAPSHRTNVQQQPVSARQGPGTSQPALLDASEVAWLTLRIPKAPHL
jgi:hypothetical protein